MRRKKIAKKVSKKLFRKTASGTQAINFKSAPMRGGFRI